MISIFAWPYSVNVKFSENVHYLMKGDFMKKTEKHTHQKKNTFAGFLQSGSKLMTYFSFLAELGLSLCNL